MEGPVTCTVTSESEGEGGQGSRVGGDGSTGGVTDGEGGGGGRSSVTWEGAGAAGMLGELTGIVDSSLGVEIRGDGNGTDEAVVGV